MIEVQPVALAEAVADIHALIALQREIEQADNHTLAIADGVRQRRAPIDRRHPVVDMVDATEAHQAVIIIEEETRTASRIQAIQAGRVGRVDSVARQQVIQESILEGLAGTALDHLAPDRPGPREQLVQLRRQRCIVILACFAEGTDIAPERVDVAPEGPDITPERRDIAPERVDVAMEGIDRAMEGINGAPEGRDVAVERVDVTVKGIDATPERADIPPERAEIAVEGIDVPVERIDVPMEGVDFAVKRVDGAMKRINVAVEWQDEPVAVIGSVFGLLRHGRRGHEGRHESGRKRQGRGRPAKHRFSYHQVPNSL